MACRTASAEWNSVKIDVRNGAQRVFLIGHTFFSLKFSYRALFSKGP